MPSEPAVPQRGHFGPGTTPTPGLGRVLEFIVEQGPTTRRAASRATGLTQPTVTRIVQDLMERGLVREGDKRDVHGSGRKPSEIELIPDGAVALGVHISASHIELGLVTLSGEVVQRQEAPIRPGEPELLANSVRHGYEELLAKVNLDPGRVLGAGVGMAGVVDRKGGTNRFAFNLDWRDVPVKQVLADALGIPVAVESNTRAMALAERRFGAGRTGLRNFLFFLVGPGVGSAVILNGRLHRGKGIAGEIGHTSVDLHGPRCNCGGRGCLELYVADPHTLSAATKAIGRDVRNSQVEDLRAFLDDRTLTSQLEESGDLIGATLAHAVDLLDLDAVILAGGLFSLPPAFDALVTRVRAASIVSRVRGVDIDLSSMGASIGIVGSAALVLDRFFRAPWLFHEAAGSPLVAGR